MKEKYILNPISRIILHIGIGICIAAYFFVFLDIYHTLQNGIILHSTVYTMIEHISATVMIVVAAALLLDIHIKQEK